MQFSEVFTRIKTTHKLIQFIRLIMNNTAGTLFYCEYLRVMGVVHNMLTLYTANGHKSRFGVIVFGYHRDRDRDRHRYSFPDNDFECVIGRRYTPA